MLYDAVEKMRAARGVPHLSVDASDTAREFFARRGFSSEQRNTVSVGNEWLSNTTMKKQLKGTAHEQAPNNVSLQFRLHHVVIAAIAVRGRRGDGAQLLHLVSAMSRERLYLFDTTLRDGAQTNGVDFTLADKLAIARMLDELGIDYIEGGYPGANPTDTQLFSEPHAMRSIFTAFGMTRRPGRSTSNDPGLAALLEANAEAICFVAKSWDYHVRVALETTLEENLASIRDSVHAARSRGREVLLDCEHFFDGYKANPAYALACARAAYEEGARWVVLCDTNGGTLPHEVEAIVARWSRSSPAIMSASTPTTTPNRRSPIRLRPCAPAPARSRARSTASASAAATPTSSRSSRP